MNNKNLLINCSTEEIKKTSKDIILLTNNYKSIIENIFINIKELDTTDKNWNNYNPIEFINNCLKDKYIFDNLYNELKEFGNNYLSLAQNLEDNIKELNHE